MKRLQTRSVLLSVFLAAGCLATGVRAASVGAAGYTNAFGTQPLAADWSTVAIAGAAPDMTAASQLDAAVQAVAATTVSSQLSADATDPPAFLSTATWCSSGFYVQTRPTGVGATLLMCTLVNGLGANAAGVTVSYNFAKLVPAAEEIDGQRA